MATIDDGAPSKHGRIPARRGGTVGYGRPGAGVARRRGGARTGTGRPGSSGTSTLPPDATAGSGVDERQGAANDGVASDGYDPAVEGTARAIAAVAPPGCRVRLVAGVVPFIAVVGFPGTPGTYGRALVRTATNTKTATASAAAGSATGRTGVSRTGITSLGRDPPDEVSP